MSCNYSGPGRCECGQLGSANWVYRKFDVRIGDKLIDRVEYRDNVQAKNVRHALIAEGAPSNISVYRNNVEQTAYDDVARATHPEEL